MRNDIYLCTSKKYISHPSTGYVILGIPVETFCNETNNAAPILSCISKMTGLILLFLNNSGLICKNII